MNSQCWKLWAILILSNFKGNKLGDFSWLPQDPTSSDPGVSACTITYLTPNLVSISNDQTFASHSSRNLPETVTEHWSKTLHSHLVVSIFGLGQKQAASASYGRLYWQSRRPKPNCIHSWNITSEKNAWRKHKSRSTWLPNSDFSTEVRASHFLAWPYSIPSNCFSSTGG